MKNMQFTYLLVRSWQQGKEKSQGLKGRRRDLVTGLRRKVRKRIISFPVCVSLVWNLRRFFAVWISYKPDGGRTETEMKKTGTREKLLREERERRKEERSG